MEVTNTNLESEIINGLQNLADNIESLARNICAEIDADPKWVDKFTEKYRNIDSAFLKRLERVGRGLMNPKLLLNISPGATKLKRLPIGFQNKLVGASVPVLIVGGETLLVEVDNLTQQQAEQVFDRDHVRELPEQRAWIETRNQSKTPSIKPDHCVRGRRVYFFNPGRGYTQEQLEKIWEE